MLVRRVLGGMTAEPGGKDTSAPMGFVGCNGVSGRLATQTVRPPSTGLAPKHTDRRRSGQSESTPLDDLERLLQRLPPPWSA